LREKLAAQARDLGLKDELIFTGTRNDPENFYPALDIVALTSLNEGTPLTLIEAMANARCVISTKVGGVVDLLGAAVSMRADATAQDLEEAGGFSVREHGIIVRPSDAEAFSEGLSRLVADETLRRAMGERGHSFVAKNYSKERLLADITNLYRELMSEKFKETTTSTARRKSKENLSSDSGRALDVTDSRLNKGDI
jgi:glycosyltransferase involved in cell wall biosynthesis